MNFNIKISLSLIIPSEVSVQYKVMQNVGIAGERTENNPFDCCVSVLMCRLCQGSQSLTATGLQEGGRALT